MDLRTLTELADDYPAYQELREQIGVGGVTQIEGMPVAAKGWLLARLARETERPVVVVTYNQDAASRLAADLARFGVENDALTLLPSSTETLIFAEGAPDAGILGRRTAALQTLARGAAKIVVGPIGAWLQQTVKPEFLRARQFQLVVGQTVQVEILEKTLIDFGYERVEAVELPGQWTRRGGILDIFPGDATQPFRVDFFGDDIETIKPFDAATQRSVGAIDALTLAPIREIPLTKDAVAEAVRRVQALLPARVNALRQVNEEGQGAEHAEHLEERAEGDLAQLSSLAYGDHTESYLSFLFPDASVCALDYLPDDAILIVDEPTQAASRWEQAEGEISEILATRAARGDILSPEIPHACPFDALIQAVAPPAPNFGGDRAETAASPNPTPPKLGAGGRTSVQFSLLGRGLDGVKNSRKIGTQSGAMENFSGRLPAFFEAVDGWLGARFRVVLVSEQAERLRSILAEHRLPTSPLERLEPGGESGVFVLDGSLLSGFKIPEAALMLATDTDIFGHRAHVKTQKRRFKEGLTITSYLELREGDYVVHVNHGIGRYAGISRLKGADGAERDYLLLLYADNDKVYVPTDQVDRVQKYIGSQESPPEITRLHSGEWTRATGKAKKQVKEMAAELIKLYAARKAARRTPLGADTPWQTEMEDAFPYEETPDQQSAIDDIKRDLEEDIPMDRLICGDVGYGKTEVAMRAAFKVASAGRQVAVLCPTTILAQQHLGTFRERLASYPVTVKMLSRFVSPKETRETLAGLADGTVDIVIGTHKLLGKETKFKNLGLLIVDEEQRFGVTHKERIKNMRKSVDALTLTATPIPRTLHMSLSGIRDMSLIDDPPEGRLPIKTYVKEFDVELVREVILRELDRQGQIYFLHNRVESIAHVAERIRRLVPTARVDIGHGQMHEDELEDVMLRFAHKEFDVLVCTTIVESGLDIPNVNTIVVDNADKLGLAQLYQLRGRVGRSNRQGYCYLLYRADKQLTEVAEKRLSALREFSDLGSGYKVALRDLEIRGAGNLLGAEQSGTVATVGFDLYTRLLSQAINELKGEDVETDRDLPNVALPLDALLPKVYIPSEAERILMYKKLAAVRALADVARIQEELEDRYGDPPRPVWNLLALLRLRLRCSEVGISGVVAEKRRVAVRFSGTSLLSDTIRKLAHAHMQHQFLPDVVFLAVSDVPAKMLQTVEEMIEVIAAALPAKVEKPKPVKKPSLLMQWEREVEDGKTPTDNKPESESASKPKRDESKERNLVSNQISARRRGNYGKGR